MSEKWFHGDITRLESETKLQGYLDEKGTFLIRLSTTEPIMKSPFTISKVNKSGRIDHQRIMLSHDRTGYYTTIKDTKNNDKKIGAEGSIVKLIKKLEKSKSSQVFLRKFCPGRKYGTIFMENVNVIGYEEDKEINEMK